MKFFAILAMMFFSFSQAHAGVSFEPYVGYETGTNQFKLTSGAETKLSLSAPKAGLRLGYRSAGFWLVGEGSAAFGGKAKPEVGDADDYTSQTVFGTMGYDFSTRLRIWAGVAFMHSMEFKDTAGTKTTYVGNSGYKVGLGYYLLPRLSISAEYLVHEYNKVKSGSTESTLADLGVSSIKSNLMQVAFSFPF